MGEGFFFGSFSGPLGRGIRTPFSDELSPWELYLDLRFLAFCAHIRNFSQVTPKVESMVDVGIILKRK